MKRKWFVSLSLAAIVFVMAACGNDQPEANNNETGTQEEPSTSEEGTLPEPNLEDIPKVVAEVNGQEILKEDFITPYEMQYQQMAMQAQLSGQELDEDQLKKQTAESLVGQELLKQEANNEGLEASQEDTEATLNELAAQYGLGSKDEFMAALKEQGFDQEEILSQVETQVKVNKLITEKSGDIEPTEEEVKATYEQLVAQQKQRSGEVEIPSLDEVRSEIKQRIIKQKEAEVTQTMIEELRQKANVTIHL